MRVEFYPHLRKIHVVSTGKVFAPVNLPKNAEVTYKAPTPATVLATVATATAVLILLAPFMFLISIPLLVLLLLVFLGAETKRKKAVLNSIKRELPEGLAISVVEDALKACRETSEAVATVASGPYTVEAVCGYPAKCVEYDKRTAIYLGGAYASVLACLVAGYFLLPSTYFLAVLAVVLALVLATAKKKICKKYVIRKII